MLSEESAILLRQNLEAGLRLTDLGLYCLHDPGPPERLFQVEYPELGERSLPLPRAPRAHVDHVALPLTRCLGRDAEIAKLCDMLRASTGENLPTVRLVTLTGPGGSGKTRLSLEVAARLRDTGSSWRSWVGIPAGKP